MGIIGVLGALAGCTDATSVGPSPNFVSLERASDLLQPRLIDFLSSCERPIGRVDPTWPRRALDVAGATIALTAGMTRSIATFGDRPGFTAVDRNMLLAVAYDDDVPVLSLSFATSSSSARPRDNFTVRFDARCDRLIDGRIVTVLGNVRLVGDPADPTNLDRRRLVLGLPMAILATAPSGRRVNVFVTLFEPRQLFEVDEAAESRLAALAWSVAW